MSTSTPTNAINPSQTVININVGVLGHVDSGKTSLVKALSTLLSTAALDKSKQSRERGMTLDLGFSCFFLTIPLHKHDNDTLWLNPNKTSNTTTSPTTDMKYQITLVDCPGHASLIRTIIGGAQIIDVVILVVDVIKGWQTQTTECLVLAELTSPHLIVALNKVDQLDEKERDAKINEVQMKILGRLKGTRFIDTTPIIGVSACTGGQKVAAIEKNGEKVEFEIAKQAIQTYNLDKLISALQEKIVPPPKRGCTTIKTSSKESNFFHFAFDHCFSIRGRGTVLTGTCLSGQASVNDTIEFPALSMERKIKSIQMFKTQVTTVREGDRAGICISNFDSNEMERGIISSPPGRIQSWKSAIALIRKVRYYPNQLHSNSKVHISVGHTTVMATVTFWGARELATDTEKKNSNRNNSNNNSSESMPTKGGSHVSSLDDCNKDIAGLPQQVTFDFKSEFLQQDTYLESIQSNYDPAKNEVKKSKDKRNESSDLPLHWALLHFHTPVYCPQHSLVIGSRLDVVNTNIDDNPSDVSSCRLAFFGRLIERIDVEKDISKINLYTTKERRGSICRVGDPYRRSDDDKIVRYDVFGTAMFKKETTIKVFIGMKIMTTKGDIGEIKSSYGTSGQFRVWFPEGIEAKEGDALILNFRRFVHDPHKLMHQNHIQLPPERPGNRIESIKVVKSKKNSKQKLEAGVSKNGIVESVKGDTLENGKFTIAIISGFFAPEINIKEKAGTKVRIPKSNEVGTIIGAFGKAGKCKVSFPDGISASVGEKAELEL
jgi:selenocysteine-specific elongation factor